MNRIQKEYITSNRKWPFAWYHVFTKYFILIAPIGIMILSMSMFYGGFRFGHIYENNFLNSFAMNAAAGAIAGLWMTYFVLIRISAETHFEQLTLKATIRFEDLTSKIKTLKWAVVEEDADSIIFSTKSSAFSWGETVTILKLDDRKILINTRPFDDNQPFTINQDKVNFKKLSAILN